MIFDANKWSCRMTALWSCGKGRDRSESASESISQPLVTVMPCNALKRIWPQVTMLTQFSGWPQKDWKFGVVIKSLENLIKATTKRSCKLLLLLLISSHFFPLLLTFMEQHSPTFGNLQKEDSFFFPPHPMETKDNLESRRRRNPQEDDGWVGWFRFGKLKDAFRFPSSNFSPFVLPKS